MMLPPESMTGCPSTPGGRVAESTMDPSDSCTGWPLKDSGAEPMMLPPDTVIGWPANDLKGTTGLRDHGSGFSHQSG